MFRFFTSGEILPSCGLFDASFQVVRVLICEALDTSVRDCENGRVTKQYKYLVD